LSPLSRSARPLALLAGTALLAGACGSSGSGGAAKGTQQVKVTMTSKGCDVAPTTVTEGPATFTVTNTDADQLNEAELMDGSRILGERENLTPGLDGSFSYKLSPGTFRVVCLGGSKQERGNVAFHVTPKAGSIAPTSAPVATVGLESATTGYAVYVREQVAELVAATTTFVDAVKAGNIDAARAAYPAARTAYERIEPVAESFGDLDPDIDARIDDVADPSQWYGFHRLEKALYQDKSLTGTAPVADKLLTDVKKLQTLTQTLTFQPAQLANGATSLLDEVAKTKVTGEEERYSHLDLLDMQANVEGAQQAYTLLRPTVQQKDPALATKVDAAFAALATTLAPYRRGNGWVDYTTVTQDQRKAISNAVNALAEPLSQVAGAVV
jgi:iron uptake system component EfeO